MWEGRRRIRRGNLFLLFPRLHFFFYSSSSSSFPSGVTRIGKTSLNDTDKTRVSSRRIVYDYVWLCNFSDNNPAWKRDFPCAEGKEFRTGGIGELYTGKNRYILDFARVNYLPLPFSILPCEQSSHPCVASRATYSTTQWVKFLY